MKLLSSKFMLVMAVFWLIITAMALINGKFLSAGIWALFSVLSLIIYRREQRKKSETPELPV